MAKHQKSKSASVRGGRNPERRNGKAWGRHHRSSIDTVGHNETGRTKPSGHSIGGHAITKIRALNPSSQAFSAAVERIKESRDTQHRKELRHGRRTTARDRMTNGAR